MTMRELSTEEIDCVSGGRMDADACRNDILTGGAFGATIGAGLGMLGGPIGALGGLGIGALVGGGLVARYSGNCH